MKIGAPFSLPTTTSTTRRALLARAGAAVGAAGAAGLAGCSLAGADHASYWSESGQLDVDYGPVMTTAREAGYTVDEPYYVGVEEARGIHPGGSPTSTGASARAFGSSGSPSSTRSTCSSSSGSPGRHRRSRSSTTGASWTRSR